MTTISEQQTSEVATYRRRIP
ncbi:MAG: hypothetical protein JWP05_847, partial [Microbacteriaceae bacterium]|nr:hypothetical protein [Microbacteriaceae bacterium]